jgi:hypothetical protein
LVLTLQVGIPADIGLRRYKKTELAFLVDFILFEVIIQGRMSSPTSAPTTSTSSATSAASNQGAQAQTTTNFALTPAAAHRGVLDYTDANNIKIYKQAVMKLHVTLFDVEAQSLSNFLAALGDRAATFEWIEILTIPLDVNAQNGPEKYLITEYGQVTLAQVVAHVKTYIGQPVRQAQDSIQCMNVSWLLFQQKEEIKSMYFAKIIQWTIKCQVWHC